MRDELAVNPESESATRHLSWEEANAACLEGELHCLRLRLKRRMLWLRKRWASDPLQNFRAQVVSDAQADQLLGDSDPCDETRFYEEDVGAAKLSQEITEAEGMLARERQKWLACGHRPALDLLGNLFGLSAFDQRVLLLCLAPELDPGFERLYAYLHDDVRRGYVSPSLAETLFTFPPFPVGEDVIDPSRLYSRLTPDAPLRYFRLVHLDPGPIATIPTRLRPLRINERVADYLRGINRLDGRIASLLRPLSGGLLTTGQQDLTDRIVQALSTRAPNERWPIVNLIGAKGVGKRAVAHRLAERLGLQSYLLELRSLPVTEPDRTELLRLLAREASLSQLALYVDVAETEPTDATVRHLQATVIEQVQAFLIVGSQERWRGERETLAAPVQKPDATAQRQLWREALRQGSGQALAGMNHSLEGQVEAMVEQFDFGPDAIAQTVRAASQRLRPSLGTDTAHCTAEDLWQAAREQAGNNMEHLARRITPSYTWDDMVLPDDVMQQLRELSGQVAQRPLVYEAWGFSAKLGRGRGISALFAGPSGTGKTMAAEVLASHLQLDLFRIDLAGVVSKYIGETEKNLKKVFDAAEQSGAILFFDEADALFGKRTEVKDSHDRYANIEVNYLLQRMEDYRGLAILATNRKSSLDSAFLRRLRFLVDFPFPRAESRRQIWQRMFPPQAPLNGMNFDHLARLDISGGNIRNIALNAAFLAAENDEKISMSHVMRAARREYAKIEKPLNQNDFGLYYEWVKQ